MSSITTKGISRKRPALKRFIWSFAATLFASAAFLQYFQHSVAALTAPTNHLLNQRTLQIVAHEDDDLIFMNPDIANTIAQGNFERTVYLTAGNLQAGGADTAYWQDREAGALAAHAKMAGRTVSQFVPGGTGSQDVRSIYTKSTITLSGGSYYEDVWTLNGTAIAGQVSVAFLRLPASVGAINTYPSVDLWTGASSQITTVGDINGAPRTYSKAQLTELLTSIMANYNPTLIRAQDASDAWTFDHDDHVMTARFSLEAFNAYRATTANVGFETYRGYNDEVEPSNISTTQMATKQAALDAYCAYDAAATGGSGCYAGSWGPRQYSTQYVSSYKGQLRSGAEGSQRCLTDSSPTVSLSSCNSSSSQVWSISYDGALKGSSGTCLTVANLASPTASMGTCASAKQWLLAQDGFLVGPGSKVFVEASGSLQLDDLFVVQSQRTTDATNGLGTITANGGDIPGAAAPTASSAPLAPTALRWTFNTKPSYLASTAPQYSDAYGWNASNTYYGSIKLADVNGDGLDDLCGRGGGGIGCSINDGTGHFGNATTWTTDFSNAGGWLSPEYGTTIQFADINGDGYVDVCGRGADGLDCGLNDPVHQQFLTAQHVSYGTAFSNANGWNANAGYYNSIRLADVNGDGYVDVCGRGSGDVVCGMNDGTGHFGPATSWISSNYTNAGGWLATQYGATMQFADINGDGKADVCGRGISGMVCGISTGSSFGDTNLWSFRNDFSDALSWNSQQSYYGSIQLVDMNGDGKADVCGRAPTGIRCGYSTGSHFTVATTLFDDDFTDAAGYQPSQYGSTLQFGKLTAAAAGRPSVCVRGVSGEMCSQPY